MKKRKTIIWTIVVIVVVGGFGIFLRSCTLEAMRIREASMRDYICTWILFSYEGTEKQLAEFLEKASSNFYLTNQVFTFDGSNIVARFAYSGQVDDKQLFSSADYQFFWANRSGKIVRGPTEKEPIKETEQRICLERETVRNMKNFIEGWMRELYKGTEESLDEFVQTNTNAIFLTNQVFSFGGSNITARFASPRIVDDRRQLFANTNVIFWVDPLGKIVKGPYEMSGIYVLREELNMENFIEGWIRASHEGSETDLNEFLKTNSGGIFLTKRAFRLGGNNFITAWFASSHIISDRRQLFANTNMYFWVDSRFGNILGEPHKVGASEEFDQQDHDKVDASL